MVFDTPVEEEELEAAIESLPQGARDALVLCGVYGYEHSEAAVDAGHRRRHLQGAVASGAGPAAATGWNEVCDDDATRETTRRAGAERAAGARPVARHRRGHRGGQGRGGHASPGRSAAAAWLPAVGMAAAVALVAIGVLIGRRSRRPRHGGRRAPPTQDSDPSVLAGDAARRQLPQAARRAADRSADNRLSPCRKPSARRWRRVSPRCAARSVKSKRRSDAIPPTRCCKSCW